MNLFDQSSANLRFNTFHFSPKPLWHEPLFIAICWFLTPFIPGPLGITVIQAVKNNYNQELVDQVAQNP